jgi:hypothetical protein
MVTKVEKVAETLEVLISKDCAFCALVDPVLKFALDKGYIGVIQRIEYSDKQKYQKTVADVATKYQQKRSYPLVMVHQAGKEIMLPAIVVDEIVDWMTNVLDDQVVLQIIIGEITWEDLGDVLQQPASKLVLGIVEALNLP